MSTPLPLSHPDIGEDEIAAVVAVLRSGRLSLGPRLQEFEALLADYVGAEHAVAVSSGTAALHLAMLGLGIGVGDEVVTASFSFIASANCILQVGATPVFVDIEPDTFNLDPAAIESKITPRTRAILVVHVFGRPVDMSAIRAIAQRHELHVIEDACEALGAEIHGRRVGALGDVGVFGFYPNKVMTTGEGGVLVTNDAELAARARRQRNQGRDGDRDWFEHVEFGFNYRLSDIACALGSAQLRRLEELVQKRATVARCYHDQLQSLTGIRPPLPECPNGRIAWFVYVVQLEEGGRWRRDAIAAHLQSQGIGCGRYFAPIHQQPVYRARGYGDQDLPITEAVGERALALPFHGGLSREDVERVVATLREALERHREA